MTIMYIWSTLASNEKSVIYIISEFMELTRKADKKLSQRI